MDNKIIIKIDLLKINKSKIEDRTYTTDAGVEVKQKLYSMELIPTMRKVIKEFDKATLVKKYFVAEAQTKEEREKQTKTPILGDGLIFENKETEKVEKEPNMHGGEAEINPDDIPF